MHVSETHSTGLQRSREYPAMMQDILVMFHPALSPGGVIPDACSPEIPCTFRAIELYLVSSVSEVSEALGESQKLNNWVM